MDAFFVIKLTKIILILIFCIHCKLPQLNNSCDPKSKDFFQILTLKYILGDVTPHCGISVFSPNTDPVDFWIPNGDINSIHIAMDRIYMTGNFSYLGPNTGTVALFDLETNSIVPKRFCPYIESNGTIYASLPDGNGGFYVGGIFDVIQGQTIENLAHVNSECRVDLNFRPNPDGNVRAITKLGDSIFVGGIFASIGGTTRSALAKLNAITGAVDTSWVPGTTSGTVWALENSGTSLYVGGDFSTLSGQARIGFGVLDTNTAVVDPITRNTDATAIYTIYKDETSLYLGGIFTQIDGQPRAGFAELSLSGLTLTTWAPSVSGGGWINSIAKDGNKLYVAGNFSTLSGIPRSNVGCFDLGVTTPTSWNPNVNNTTNSIFATNGKVFVGGFFNEIGTKNREFFGVIDAATGVALDDFNPIAINPIYTIHKIENRLILGGNFISIGGVKRNYAGALDLKTGKATPWDPNTDTAPIGLTSDANYIYIYGSFSSLGGGAYFRESLAQTDPITGIPTNFDYIFSSNSVNSAVAHNSILYLGGTFTTVNLTSYGNLASIDLISGTVLPWNPQGDGSVRTLAIYNDSLYASGDFSNFGVVPRNRIAKFGLDGTLDTTFNPTNDSTSMYHFSISDGLLFVAGDFSNFNGTPRTGKVEIDAISGTNTNLNYTADNGTFFSSASPTHYFITGFFTTIAGQPRISLAKIEKGTGDLSSWNPKLQFGNANRILVHENYALIGGSFIKVNDRMRPFFAVVDQETGSLIE